MHDADSVFSKPVRAKLDGLNRKLQDAKDRVRDIEREIEELLVGQSPIVVGSVITWASGARERRGRVRSIASMYRGFEYRVVILTKSGREIGMATVREDQSPMLE